MPSGVVQFAASLAAISLLILLAYRLGFSGKPQLADEAEAEKLADEVSGGFVPVATVLAPDRSAALLRDEAGRVVLVAVCGAHFISRLASASTAFSFSGDSLRVQDGLLTGEFDLRGLAGDWEPVIARLE